MPRQTNAKNLIFPDGFKLEIETAPASWTDIGVIAGGATLTFNWDEMYLDAGNYEGLVDKAINPTIALAPSAIWNWDIDTIKEMFGGLFSSTSATTPETGKDLKYAGTSNQIAIARKTIRLTHFTDASNTEIDWQFTLNNAKIDAGASFNFKGVNEDGLNEISVSFTGKPDPASTYSLFTFFKAT